nr:GNAT family N-acetyltransferase [uncultured Desulfuromonas sp.]
MVIRSAQLSDTQKIAATHKASIEGLCADSYDTQSIAGWVAILLPAIYESAIKDKVMIVAEEQGDILGLGILDVEQATIGAIYIHPKAKGTGCGRKLLLELEAIAMKNEVTELTLFSTINALGFYQHHGYVGLEKSFHKLPNGIELECIKMHKML